MEASPDPGNGDGQEGLFQADSFLVPDPNTLPGGIVSDPPSGDVRPLHIRRLWCENFKGFDSVEIELDAFSVLVGANSTGKSTLLQAVDLGHRLLQVHAITNGPVVELPEGEGRLILPDILPVAAPRDLWYGQKQRVGRSGHVGVVIGIEYEDGTAVEFTIRSLFGSLNSRISASPGALTHEKYQRIAGRPPVIVPAAVGVVVREEYRTPARRAGLLASGRPNEIIRNHLHALREEKPSAFEAISEILGNHFGARVRDAVFEPKRDQFITATYAEGDFEHDLFSAGGGFLQVLQLLTFAFAYDAGLLGLDEPDAHLHSSLQQIVVRILEQLSADNGMQVILSTHSKEIINFVDTAKLIPVRKGETSLRPLRPYQTALELLQDVGAVDNVDAYSLLLSKRCAFVEGKSDARFLKRFASKMDSTVFEGDTKVVLVVTQGVTETRHLQQLTLFEQMADISVASLQIVDRDGLPAQLLDDFVGGAERPVHVLDRDSIENYLLAADPLMRVVNAELERRGDGRRLGPDEMNRLLDESAESLRDASLRRSTNAIERFHIIQRTDARPSAGDMADEARKFVDDAFQTHEGKIATVQGRKLLSVIRNRCQDEFGVAFTNDRLIEEFEIDEIPEEIGRLVRQLEDLGS